jgi:hypothetical protein
MADAMVECRTLEGMDRKAVLRLLGRPEDGAGRELSYELGEDRGPASLDSEFLDVQFDASDKVKRVSIG